jgi:steroid delta-isomerase-like uncharacterized protein
MGGTDNKAIFRRFYEGSWNSGDLAIVDELLAVDFVNHEVEETTIPHRELYKRVVVETRSAFPDWTLFIEAVIAERGQVAARWRAHGTHTGELEGLPPPTGERLVVQGISMARVEDGKIVEFWKQQSDPQAS